MSVNSQWDDLQKTVLQTVCRNWTWAALQTHEAEVIRPMLASVHHPVAMIIKTHAMAVNHDMSHTLQLPEFLPPQFGHSLDILIFVTNFEASAMPLHQAHARYKPVCQHYSIAPSLNAARRMIHRYRASQAV